MNSIRMNNDIESNGKAKNKSRRAKVAYSYTPVNDDELQLEVDEIIQVLSEVEEGWWMGSLDGKIGVFPSNFVVEITSEEENSKQKSEDDESPNPPTDEETVKAKPVKAMGFGNIFSSGAIKLKSTNELSPDNKGGRVISPTSPALDAPKLPPKPVRDQAVVLYSYEAKNSDELELMEGAVITILSKEVEDAGWWKGELNGKIGVFPDNFVKILSSSEPSQTKPSRPDMPMCTSSTKTSRAPDPPSNSKPQEPLKAKEPSKSPIPPPNWKKQQIPPPVKKPQRSPKPSATTTPPQTMRNSQNVGVAEVTNSNGVQELLTDDMKAKSQDLSHNDLNEVQTNENKLTHLTVNRAKVPARRPPSHFASKEAEDQEDEIEGESTQPTWMKELKKTQKAKRSSQIIADETSVSPRDSVHIEKPPKPSPPSKPVPPAISKDKPKIETSPYMSISPLLKQKEPTSNSPIETSQYKSISNLLKEKEPCVKPKVDVKVEARDNKTDAFQEALNELRKELEEMKSNTVPKSDFLELREEFNTLKEAHEVQKVKFNKRLLELMSELDEEKKIRMSMTVEVDRIKKLAMS